MKSEFKYYLLVWGILVVLFNVIIFVTPNEINGLCKYEGSFWIGYIFIMLTACIHLGLAWYSMKDNLQKMFYRIPLLVISCISVVVMLGVGLLCMLIPNCPIWVGIILCLLVLGFSIIVMSQALTAANMVGDIDSKIKTQTFFIKSLTVDIESLMARSTSSEISAELKKVYEAVRYSDPVSNDALSSIESSITIKVSELTDCVGKADLDRIVVLANEIVILVNDRNKKCMLLK